MTLYLGPLPGIRDPGPKARIRDSGPLRGPPAPGTLHLGPYMLDTWDQSKKSHFVYLPQVGFV